MSNQLKYKVGYSLSIVLVISNFHLRVEALELPRFINNPLVISQQNSTTVNSSAQKLFRNAYENRYTWNDNFPGYTATVDFKQGKDKYTGSVRVNPDLSVEVTGIKDEAASQTVKNQLLMLAVHRKRSPFEVTHKNKTFKFDSANKSGVMEVIEEGGKSAARYQIANNQIIQVSRLLGPHAVVVKTLGTETTPEGYIATKYQSTFRNAKTNQLIGLETSSDSYNKVGDYYLPIRQVVEHTEDGDKFEAQFEFTQIKLMQSESN